MNLPQLTDIHGQEGSLTLLLMGDGHGDLPGVRNEFRAIIGSLEPLRSTGYLDVTFLLGENLTLSKVKESIQAKHYHIVHYAGHTFDQGLFLPLADADVNVGDFMSAIAQNPPTLFLIDACHALGSPHNLDLATPWAINSGAIAVIGTSALVDDSAPAEVFPRFYASLIRQTPIGFALLEAGVIAQVQEVAEGFVMQCILLGDPSMTL